ncbi:MAG: class I SAM-dependent methyltransferase [Bacteroidota bacterium]
MLNREEVTKKWYDVYYGKHGKNRNNLRRNKEVLFQNLALEVSVIRAFGYINQDSKSALVLDVGCGNGVEIFQFVRLDFQIENIYGIDLNNERLEQGIKSFPQAKLTSGDASNMPFEKNKFDIVFESTMFSTLPDDNLCQAISNEMVRVCKHGGYLVLVDWRYKKPQNPNYNALNRKNLSRYFSIGTMTELITIQNGALIPPLGRFLSRRAPSLYFLIAKAFPLLVGQVVYVLKKIEKE